MPSADKAFAVDSTKLECGEVWGETDAAVHWKGAFAVYGGHGATASSVIVYEIEPAAWLAHRRDRRDAVHRCRHRQALYRGRLHNADRTWQRVRAADADAPRRREYRQGNAARRRFLRRGHVHAGFRSGDDAAEGSHPRHAKPRGLRRRLGGLSVEELAQLVLRLVETRAVGDR